MENYYQQPQQFYGGYQRQRPMQQIAPGYVCKPVTSREEAIATSTDYYDDRRRIGFSYEPRMGESYGGEYDRVYAGGYDRMTREMADE